MIGRIEKQAYESDYRYLIGFSAIRRIVKQAYESDYMYLIGFWLS
jgi:hypothetical protein